MKTHDTLRGSFLLPVFLMVLSCNYSSAQKDFVFASYPDNHAGTETNARDSAPALNYLQINTVEKIKGEFKDLSIKIVPNTIAGMMTLEINSGKNRNIIVEFKNNQEDVLLYKPFELKTGNNIIPFETDNSSVGSFRLVLSEPNSNSSISFLLLKN